MPDSIDKLNNESPYPGLRLTARTRHGGFESIVVIVVAVVLTGAIIYVCLRLFNQSEEHLTKVRETNVSYVPALQFNSDASECDEAIKADLKKWPNRREAKYTRIEFSEDGMRYIGKMRKLERLTLRETSVKDDWLKHIENLPLTNLSLNGSRITDKSLDHIAKITTLQGLNLDETDITDDGIKKLAPLKNLSTLRVGKTGVTDKGVEHLSQFRALENIELDYSKVTSACFSRLRTMPTLREISLADNRVKTKDLEKLNSTKVVDLSLVRCEITDEELREISRFAQKMLKLDLSRNIITDKGLVYLAKQKSLRQILLAGCPNITTSGVHRLRADLPKCYIYHDTKTQKEIFVPKAAKGASLDKLQDFQPEEIFK